MRPPRTVTVKIYNAAGSLAQQASISAAKGARVDLPSVRNALEAMCKQLEADNHPMRFHSVPTGRKSYSIVPSMGNA